MAGFGGGDFLAKIKLVLEGKQAVVSGLKETQQAAKQLSSTKVTTIFDKEGVVTGKQIQETFKGVGKEAKQSFQSMSDFSKALQRAAVVAPVWMLLRSAMMSVMNLVKSQILFYFDMEDAMARIQIVGKGTAEQYDVLKQSLIGLSLAYGISSTEALKAAVIFAQQGKTVSETFTLTRTAMIGAQVLGKDVASVVEDMTAAMNAFNIPAQNSVDIINKFINVEKQFAVTAKDLSDGVKVTGATANMVGVSLAALTGDITAVIEVTRKSGAEAARGLQFIYARLLTTGKPVVEQLTGIKFQLDEQGKATSALTGINRSATEILDELAGKWDTLTNKEQLNIATALGSKRQLVVMSALMSNYNHALDARVSALTSAGSAEKALAILMETSRYKAQQTAAAMNALTMAVGDTSAWKGLLDSLTTSLVFYTKLVNFEKGYRIELTKESATQMANIETRQSQVSSIEELIKLRDKLLAEPASDKTTERIEKLNKAIEEIAKDQPELKLVIESGKPEEIKAAAKDLSDKLLAEKITVQVGVEYIPKLAALSKREGELKKSLSLMAPIAVPFLGKNATIELKKIEKDRAKIIKEQTEESQKQLSLAKAQKIEKDITDDEESLRLQGKLTDKDIESLDIARKLNNYKILNNATTVQAIQKEIELVKNTNSIYELYEKNVKLAQLENQLIDEKLKKRDDEISKLGSLAMMYEKADMFEKSKIRRAAELALMPEEQIAQAYQGSQFDKSVITDYWSTFTKEAQRAIEQSTDFFKEMQYRIPTPEILGVDNKLNNQGLPTPIAQVTNFGAQNVNVNVDAGGMATAEEVINLINKMIDEKLMTDESFINTFAKRIGPKI